MRAFAAGFVAGAASVVMWALCVAAGRGERDLPDGPVSHPPGRPFGVVPEADGPLMPSASGASTSHPTHLAVVDPDPHPGVGGGGDLGGAA